MDLIKETLEHYQVPHPVSLSIIKKFVRILDLESKVKSIDMDLIHRDIPRHIRVRIFERLLGLTMFADVCSHTKNIDVCGADILVKALTQAGFINLPYSVNHKKLFKGLMRLRELMAQYTDADNQDLSNIIPFYSGIEFYNQCTPSEIMSVNDDLLDLILRNKVYTNDNGQRSIVQDNPALIKDLESDLFMNALLQSPSTIERTIDQVLEKYYVPQNIKDNIALAIMDRLDQPVFKEIMARLVLHGANVYKVMRPLIQQRRGRTFVDLLAGRNLINEAIKESLIHQDYMMIHDILDTIVRGHDPHAILNIPELLAFTYKYTSYYPFQRYLLNIATDEEISDARDIYESAE